MISGSMRMHPFVLDIPGTILPDLSEKPDTTEDRFRVQYAQLLMHIGYTCKLKCTCDEHGACLFPLLLYAIMNTCSLRRYC